MNLCQSKIVLRKLLPLNRFIRNPCILDFDMTFDSLANYMTTKFHYEVSQITISNLKLIGGKAISGRNVFSVKDKICDACVSKNRKVCSRLRKD